MDWTDFLVSAAEAGANYYAGQQDRKTGQQAAGMTRDMWNQAAQYNRPNQSNPWETSTWDQDPTSEQMTQTVKLNDKDQARLDAARDIYASNLAAAGAMKMQPYDPNYNWREHTPGLLPQSHANDALRGLTDPWASLRGNSFQGMLGATPIQIPQKIGNSFQGGGAK